MRKTFTSRVLGAALAAAALPVLASCPAGTDAGLRSGDRGESSDHAVPSGGAPEWPEIAIGPGALEAEAARVRRILGADFQVRVSPPFVVCADVSPDYLDRLCTHTVRDYLDALKRDFFTKEDPSHVHRIFLFKDGPSYRKHAKALFDDTPRTPYGYYDPRARSLIMDISTGGGTLIHEMVHALRKYDFPRMPVWFDEGLASLFEQCTLEDDHIKGLVNWRLGVFAAGFRKGGYVPLRELMSMDASLFSGIGISMHYAEARYLCLYMQELGILRSFYSAFRDGFSRDPTGAVFLAEAAGKPIEDLEKEWLDWVGKLKW